MLSASSGRNIKLAEDILAPLGITGHYTDDEGNLTVELTIDAPGVQGATQVFNRGLTLAFGTYPMQEVPLVLSEDPTVSEVSEPVGPISDVNPLPEEVKENQPNYNNVGFTAQAIDPDGETVTYEINSLGIRGREVEFAKPEGRIRLALLGDEIAFGIGVPEDATLAVLVERELLAARPGNDIEVLNLALPAYKPVLEVRMLELFASRLALRHDLLQLRFLLVGQDPLKRHPLWLAQGRDRLVGSLTR